MLRSSSNDRGSLRISDGLTSSADVGSGALLMVQIFELLEAERGEEDSAKNDTDSNVESRRTYSPSSPSGEIPVLHTIKPISSKQPSTILSSKCHLDQRHQHHHPEEVVAQRVAASPLFRTMRSTHLYRHFSTPAIITHQITIKPKANRKADIHFHCRPHHLYVNHRSLLF